MQGSDALTDRTSLGDRMKGYEAVAKTVLPARTYAVLRADGRAFHSLLRHAAKPFDFDFMADMDATAVALCMEIQGAALGYVQSDEISVLVCDFSGPNSQPWFGGEVQKQVSIAAATASVVFSGERRNRPNGFRWPGTFDARVFTLPNAVEVGNYFLWRQRDAIRNSIAMAAQAKFPHKQLHRVDTTRMRQMLLDEHGIDWDAYPDGAKRGRVVVKASGEQEVTFTHKRTGQTQTTKAVRTWWEVRPAPVFSAEPGGWLAEMVPAIPERRDEESGVVPEGEFEAHAAEALAIANEEPA